VKRIILLSSLFLCLISAQALSAEKSNVQQLIDHRNEEDFKPIEFMQESFEGQPEIDGRVLSKANYFFLDQGKIDHILENRPEAIKFSIPTAYGIRTVKLVAWNIFSEDFVVRAASAKDQPFDYEPGMFYGGVIEGFENSMVSFSFFKDEVIGMMSSHEEGKYNFGKIHNSDMCLHVGFHVNNAMFDIDFSCELLDPENGNRIINVVDEQINQKNAGNNPPTCCVQVYFELDNDLVVEKGGVVGATNFFNGLFAQIAILYDNDDICVESHSILAWDVPDGYPTGSTIAALQAFDNNALPAGADLGHLVSRGSPTNGGVAWLDQLCSALPYAYSWIQANYQNVPTFSWSVEVITHEMGHNLASPHTHDCVWNGNNTAIDGCGPASGNPSQPGGCPQGPIPGGGGTIMSYCHLGANPGINFNNGFSPQVATLIESRIDNCLGQCCTINPTTTVNNGTSCSNTQDGSATISVSGGPYTYLWDNGNTNATASDLSAGSHSCTITAATCTDVVTVTISAPTAVTGTISNISNLTCNGASNGSATVTGGGGTPTYNYLWDNGITTQTNTTLTGGNHSVTITDSNGCATVSTLNITEPAAITFTATVLSNASCNGASDGSATVSQGGGTPPYTYVWDDGSTAGPNNNLPAGTHNVTLSDANGCTAVASVTITAPAGISVSTTVVSQASCNGASDGSATATANGGANPISYSWDNGENVATAIALNAGTHLVTVTDNTGCTATGSVTITEPTAIALTTTSISGVSCPNDTNGSASVATNGGNAPYTILWDNAEATATATTLTGGPHTVTVTDANSCSQTATVTITSPPLVFVTETHVDVSCNGLSDGSISLTATGGTPPLSYLWSNGSTVLNQTNLTANTYTLTVTDNNGCTDITTVVINEPTAVSVATTVNSNVGCFGASDGSATATGGGGTAPYTYTWGNGEATATATALANGSTNITVTDDTGCSVTGSVTITQPASFTASATVVSNATCNGDTDGSATATQQGGTPPYTYLWDNTETNATATSLGAGTHVVTVTDDNGCEATASIAITEPTALTATVAVDNNVSCNGLSDGGATVTPAGGTPPYSYLWDNGEITAGASSLPAGAHTVTITDDNGCDVIANTTITQPAAITATATLDNDVSCSGAADGGATANGAGGNPPLSYLWDNGTTTATVTNLTAGTHIVTVSDISGCATTASVVINQPGTLVGSIMVINNVSCFGGNDGSATVSVTGGLAPFSYSWDNSETTATATALTSGNHDVTVSDVNGCSIVVSTNLTQPPSMSISTALIDDVSCNGLSDGSASAAAGGGTAPFVYLWDNTEATSTATALNAGTHIVTITDDNGCAETASVVISEPALLTANITLDNNVVCNGETNGGATAAATGGTAPYSYLWDNSETTNAATGLNAGAHSVSVTDANGCLSIATITITEPSALTASTTLNSNVSCNGGTDGSATAAGAGGTAPYSFLWNNGVLAASATNLPAGTHSVTVTDANSCTATASVVITEPVTLTGVITVNNNVSCNGGSDGNASVNVGGGTMAYTYNWDNNETTATATSLTSGSHDVTVTDANNCTIIVNTNITQPTIVTASTTLVNDVSCNGGSDGSATATGAGGTAPFSYLWDNTEATATATSLNAGTHIVTVTDNNGCAETASILIGEPTLLTAMTTLDNNVACNGESNGGATAAATGGTPPYSYLWENGEITIAASGLDAGTHNVSISDGNGCLSISTIVITEPVALTASTILDNNVPCNGGSDGGATAKGAGGTTPYTYLWDNGVAGAMVTNLNAGTHIVTVTDANSCTTTASVVVTEAAVLVGAITVNNNVSCNGGSDGNATVSPGGGTPPYTYNWDNNETTATATGLNSGNHNVTVTDDNNCILVISTNITQPTVITLTTTLVNNASCNGFNDGSATANGGGGVSPYAYLWDNGETNSTATALLAGTHTVTLTDANSCTETATVVITQPTVLAATTSLDKNVTCNGETNGGATVNANGGTVPYTYLWDNNETTSSAVGLWAGLHAVSVTDNNGCVVVASILITEPLVLTSTVTLINDALCNGDSDGSAIALGAGGTVPYTYLWDNGETNGTAQLLNAGTHVVTITDFNGCTTTNSVIVNEPAVLSATTTNNSNVSCNGLNDGDATVTATGGTTPYSYLWDNGVNTVNTNTLNAGTHTVSVTDANGCAFVASVTITEPPVLSSSVTINNNVTCNGQNDGNATVNGTGGTTPYTYSWDNGVITTQTASNLAPGSHVAFVTDANGCVSSITLLITEPNAITASVGVDNNVSCNGLSDGGATVLAQGGTLPFSYNWDNGETTVSAVQLNAGTHILSITDANGCLTTASVIITEPPLLVATSVFVSDVTCNGGSDGVAGANGVGGTPPYSYLWPSGETTAIAVNLTAGSQTTTVTDGNGCVATTTVTIGEPTALTSSSVLVSNVTCNGFADGSATVSQTGGTPGYAYLWDNGETTPTALNLTGGTHSVTVTDFNGCTSVSSVVITEPQVLTANITNGSNVKCNGEANGSAIATGLGGTNPYAFLWDNGETSQVASGLTAGAHSVIVTDANGCTATASVTVNEPTAITVNISAVTDITCFGLTDGAATATATGGIGPFVYQWDSGEFGPSAVNLSGGINVVTVTDTNGCISTAAAIINEPTALTTTTALINNISCNGLADGNAEVIVLGGVSPYSYMWTNGQVSNQLTNVGPGSYSVTVTDTNGCVSITSVGVSEPQPVSVSVTAGNTSCIGTNDGTATAQGAGGTPPYAYQWSNGETQQTAVSYTPGQHTVTVTDSNGCSAANSFVIGSPDAITLVNLNLVPVACFGGNDGSATVNVTGGTPPYAYQWSTGANTNTESGLSAGNYQITITDIAGCELVANVAITEPTTAMGIQISGTDVECFGETTGMVTVVATGGNSAYTYLWNNGSVQQTIFNVSAGNYAVTVTDQNGCMAVAGMLIDQPTQMFAQIEVTDAICPEEANGSIAVDTVTGGVFPYIYSTNGDFFQTDTVFTGLTAGNYDIYVQDLNGCILETNNVIVDENEPIVIEILDAPTIEIVLGDSLELANTVTPVDTNHVYSWEPTETLSCSDCPEPIAKPFDDTEYILTVTDSLYGCNESASILVTVNKERHFFVPNAFSPNGDGINDVLLPFGGPDVAVIRSFNIFDRWGEQLHTASSFAPNDPEFGWDGRFKGKKAQSGVYVYHAVVEFIDGIVIEYNADITLIK